MEEREEKQKRLFMFGTEMQETWPDWIKYIYTFFFSPQTFVSTF